MVRLARAEGNQFKLVKPLGNEQTKKEVERQKMKSAFDFIEANLNWFVSHPDSPPPKIGWEKDNLFKEAQKRFGPHHQKVRDCITNPEKRANLLEDDELDGQAAHINDLLEKVRKLAPLSSPPILSAGNYKYRVKALFDLIEKNPNGFTDHKLFIETCRKFDLKAWRVLGYIHDEKKRAVLSNMGLVKQAERIKDQFESTKAAVD